MVTADYKNAIEKLQQANAEAFAAHTNLVASVLQISVPGAVAISVKYMQRDHTKICDYRIVKYLKILGIE